MADRHPMYGRCFKEVVELHQFIQDWLNGSVAKTHRDYSRFKDALAKDFQMIDPSGTTKDQNQVTDSFWLAHRTKDVSFSIEIKNLCHRISFGNYSVITYEEWQYDQTTSGRLSTVLFRNFDQKDKLHWVHLHETWLSI